MADFYLVPWGTTYDILQANTGQFFDKRNVRPDIAWNLPTFCLNY